MNEEEELEMKRLHEEMERDVERKRDNILFRGFCLGAAFTFVFEIVVEMAFRRAGL